MHAETSRLICRISNIFDVSCRALMATRLASSTVRLPPVWVRVLPVMLLKQTRNHRLRRTQMVSHVPVYRRGGEAGEGAFTATEWATLIRHSASNHPGIYVGGARATRRCAKSVSRIAKSRFDALAQRGVLLTANASASGTSPRSLSTVNKAAGFPNRLISILFIRDIRRDRDIW